VHGLSDVDIKANKFFKLVTPTTNWRITTKAKISSSTLRVSFTNPFIVVDAGSSQWSFFTQGDPTHGLVDYQSKSDAVNKGLAYVQDDGTAVLKVDNSTQLSSGQNRASVRITSKKQYSGGSLHIHDVYSRGHSKFNCTGLFIADFYAMPHGCSLWPAYWSVGPNWPNGGEIDILEGANLQSKNQYVFELLVFSSLIITILSQG
jgi:hypothetical protein